MISGIFIRRPVLASVLSIVVVIAGLVAMAGLPITQYPEIAPVQVTVSASYPGADAETVANTVAAPLETQINGVDNMIYMQSTSSATGEMELTVFFTIDTDPDTAEVQVNNRVNLALPDLPDAVRAGGVRVQKRSSSFLMLIGIYSPDGRYDEQYVGNYANVYILDAIKRVPGANQAQIMGLPDLAMRIWLKPDRMASLGITPADIQRAVSQQNQQFGVGRIGQSPTGEPVEMTFPVVTEGRFTTPREFEDIILRTNARGTAIVRLGDVGRAEEGLKAYLLRSSLNGTPATFIAIYQQPGSNALQVSRSIRELMAELKPNFPEGIDYTISLDTTQFVKASIDEVVTTLIVAIVLVVLVTYLFLQNVNATLIPTIAIFVSVIGTFIGMQMLGFSINLLTLFGLVLAIGTVCDDAIVVVENVERNLADGLSPRDATFRAMEEVTGPVIATTLVLIAVFVPVAFLGGTTGVLYQQFAMTIAVSVAISSFVALTLTPALAALLLKPREGEPGGFFGTFNRWLAGVTEHYARGVRLTLQRIGIALIVLGAMLFATWRLFEVVPGSFVPPEDQGYVFAAVILPDGASLDRTQALTQKVADIFAQHPAVQDYSALSGFSLLDSQFKTNAGTVFVALKDFAERSGKPELSARALFDFVAPQLAALKEGVVLPINPPSIPGLGSQGGFEFWVQNRGQGDMARLERITRRLIARAGETPVVTHLNTTINAASRQLRADLDRAKAEVLGVPVADAYAALQTLFGSLYVSQYNKYGRVWQVILQAEPQYRQTPEDINNIFVRQRNGKMVPLAALIDTRYITGPDLVSRFNGFPAAKINGDAAPGYSSGQAIATMEATAAQVLPDGFTYAWAGQAFEEKQAGSTAVLVFAFALVMVFLILSAQYEQWSLPVAVITAVPFGLFGALLSVWLRGMENDVYFQIGLITLIGLSAKNAILIVEFAELKYREGMRPFEAAVEAARLRLRPILMTSLSFILGALPLVLASGAGAAARHSIGTGIIGGMIGATTLALFFVPLFYYLIMRAKERLGAARRHAS